MIGIVYLLNCILVGAVFCDFFLPHLGDRTLYHKDGKEVRIPGFFVYLPAWFITGTVFQTWLTYFVGYGFRSLRHPLTPANAIVIPTLFVLSMVYFVVKAFRTKDMITKSRLWNFFFGDRFGYLIFTVLITLFAIIIMYRTLYVEDNNLHVGYSVWADFGAHLGMIRSFSYGNNFPTQYTYFGGEDIRYHFMFQFLVGNLEYLGLSIDHAFNIPSIMGFVSMYLLLFTLTVQLLGSRLTAWIGALLFTFRSSPSLFIYLGKNTKAGSALVEGSEVTGWEVFKGLSSYFTYSNYQEGWGFWCTRVFCNQRHLALGISALLLALIVFLPYLQSMGEKLTSLKNRKKKEPEYADERIEVTEETAADTPDCESSVITESTGAVSGPENTEAAVTANADGKQDEAAAEKPEGLEAEELKKPGIFTYIREIFFTKDGWFFGDPKLAIGMGLFLGAMGFWHGSALIATLAMLFFMAAFSSNRLDYVITAGLATGLTLLESKFFINGSAVSPSYYFGFIADNKTFWGVMLYVFLLTGITITLAIFGALKYRGVKRYMLFVFTVPFIISFFLKLTPDIGVNHKWVIMSLMLISMFTADFVADFLRKRDVGRWITAVVLIFVLTATGIAELKIQASEDTNSMVFDQDNEVTLWIKDNIDSSDLVLTDTYPLTNIVLGGVISYYSYPYCAWSAGYDTTARERLTAAIYSADTPEELDYYIDFTGIDYIIIDVSIRECSDYTLNEENIENTYEEVFSSGEGKWAIRIFDTSKKK